MPDTLMLAGARPSRLVRNTVDALELVGRSAAISRVQELIRRVSVAETGVLLVAERGADLESVARELHGRSRRVAAPFVVIDCACDAAQLNRLLFGVPAEDAPSDLEMVSADSHIAGARGGTLFLCDVAELPASVQTRLARIVRDGEARIDGQPAATTFRLIASALPGIEADVQARRFRSDLYRRLSTSRIDLPPLRDRPDDITALATRMVEDLSAAQNIPPPTVTQAALALLAALTWPGNVAELHGVIARVVAEVGSATIQIEHLLRAVQLDRAPAPFVPVTNLREARLRFERDYIASVLHHHGWRIADAAKTLGIQRPNLYRKARQLGIPLRRATE